MGIANVTNFVGSDFPCSYDLQGRVVSCLPLSALQRLFRGPHFCGCGLFQHHPEGMWRSYQWLTTSDHINYSQSFLPESWGCWSTPVINSRHGRLTTANLGVNQPQTPGRERILRFPWNSASGTLPGSPRWPDSDGPRSVFKCPFSSCPVSPLGFQILSLM